MKGYWLFIFALVAAACVPLCTDKAAADFEESQEFPGWPETINGRPIKQLPLSSKEKYFADSFPGKVGLFYDGQRKYIIRWVTEPTRRLHPASDCFKGIGYSIKHLPIRQVSKEESWSSFKATKDNQIMLVHERVYDLAGNNWTDVSAWFWSATLGSTKEPWWVVTTVEKVDTLVDGQN